MNKAICLIFFFILSNFCITAQNHQDSLVLTTNDQWRNEMINFPLSFAPEIDLKGYEDIRFLKGWHEAKSEEFWSYGFVWVLKEKPLLSEKSLNIMINQYFDGLMDFVG